MEKVRERSEDIMLCLSYYYAILIAHRYRFHLASGRSRVRSTGAVPKFAIDGYSFVPKTSLKYFFRRWKVKKD